MNFSAFIETKDKYDEQKMAPNQNYILTDARGDPVSRTYQYRKVMKPLLERKRRARINRCLDELKELMTGAFQTVSDSLQYRNCNKHDDKNGRRQNFEKHFFYNFPFLHSNYSMKATQ